MNNSTTNPCVICLDPLTAPCTALPCSHKYDYICLISWLDLRPTCPLCNAQIRAVEVFDETQNKLIQVHPLYTLCALR